MKDAFEIIKLMAIAVGMAITISCNTILVSLFKYVGGISLCVTICMAGLLMGVIVLCFTELSSKFPGAIGIRAFTKAAFGNRLSLAATLFYVCMVIFMGALEMYLCHLLLQQLFSPLLGAILLCLLVLLILAINLYGYELSLRVQVAMTLAVIGMMAVLSTIALDGQAVTTAGATHENTIYSIPRALFLFVGVEWAIMHVSRHASFKKNLPVALILTVLTIALLYSLFGIALQARLPQDALASTQLPHLELARVLGSQSAIWLVAFISLLAVLTSFNVGLSGAARILYSLSREREIPVWFSIIHGSNLAPRNAMLFIAASVSLISSLMIIPEISANVGLLFSFHLSLTYSAVLLAWLKMRHRNDKRGIRQPIHPLIVATTLIVLLAVSLGSLSEIQSQVVRLILLVEAIIICSICLYLPKTQFLKETQ